MKRLRTKHFELQLNGDGMFTGLQSADTGKDYSYSSGAGTFPLIRIVRNETVEEPSSCGYNENLRLFSFEFKGSGTQIEVKAEEKLLYITFEIGSISGEAPDALLWGPFATSIAGSVGESVGVVHDGEFAAGIQVLNEKTIGGFPSDVPQPHMVPYPDAKMEYCGCAAWPLENGSMLQAYVRNRTKPSRRTVWNVPDAAVSPMAGFDAEIEGSKIALFGCPVANVLEIIEAIELGEGLPHPTIEGVWGKTSPAANQSYLITDFSERTINTAVEYAKKAELRYVYHPDPFANWGHFQLKPDFFPNGDDSLKACVEAAEREGVHVGVHTLSNFTTLNDPYVTPVPDERLQRVGVSRLAAAAEAGDTEITVDDPQPFLVNLYRRTAVIGGELIEYDSVSEGAPWKLQGCRRGVNGTAPMAHAAGEEIGRLWDHPYDVFFPNLDMQDEYCDRIVELFRGTGVRQISFDGLEGVYATGHEDYAVSRFVKRCFDGWKQEVINDASLVVTNYLWHVHTRFNWGEPWGAATREGQLSWRLHNQRYFARNFIPRMLGWFLIRSASDKFEATTPDEIEWVLSKAAGFDAGFALVADLAVLQRNGNADALLGLVREWETARRRGAFTKEQRERMEDPKSDWHLEPAGEGRWSLWPIEISNPLVCNPEELQPGQPGGADWAFYNKYGEQPLRFCLKVIPSYGNEEAWVSRPTFQASGEYITFETDVHAGQYLVCDGDGIGKVYDNNWNLVKTVAATADAPTLKSGGQTISFSCRFGGNPKPSVSVKLFTRGEPENVGG
ncbi:hypothetical protein [Paenibacillus thermotolerans]|uniref:hypothetical protein n=1 Tax=Paenibacillus thermotolerans TaxID=3027807 RepID=UPI002367B1A5|nr:MULTISPECIES: hypothetical protein [unclassified Paenibacillus]